MAAQTHDDPFDFENSLLNLEEDFYQQGYAQGVSDGAKAGRTEGRQLGLEKGFQKFVQSGRLHGRAIVWANRLPSKQDVRRHHLLLQQQSSQTGQQQQQAQTQSSSQDKRQKVEDTLENLTLGPNIDKPERKEELRLLPNNARLEKHVSTLFALAETDTLAKENTDEAVNDFDDRLKRAQGKAKIVERMVGEVVSSERKKANPNPPAAVVGGPGESSGTGAGAGTGTPIAGVDLGRIGTEV
ncbi:uncharacterized protein B0T23DRAFT_371870 [Neurospora hispaniola]|uniref:Essential protein Yae1 N-terminal domain-containing protein n=1 Tax=Neurospora hispaniola TaxID=588809 RepID=A0AAJ0IHA3_9PEZI|nr:hypothetical protein B0T23DRAFT_371870 [Neurospora hispaniola]